MPSPALTWKLRLRGAETESEVVDLAREYLALLDRVQLAMLPPRCRPRSIVCPHDVSSYAFELLGYYCEQDDASARVVQSLAAFFTDASVRVSEIVSDTNVREAEARGM